MTFDFYYTIYNSYYISLIKITQGVYDKTW